jgi:hypothetical protein
VLVLKESGAIPCLVDASTPPAPFVEDNLAASGCSLKARLIRIGRGSVGGALSGCFGAAGGYGQGRWCTVGPCDRSPGV